jgi:hypothetical protein
MAMDPTETTRPTRRDELPAAPLAGSRSQSMQRLQIGLFGLAAMTLLVSLANIILNNAEKNEARVVPEAAPTVAAENGTPTVSDPLADAGVVPDMPDAPEQGPAGTQGQSGDAPALQP